MATVMEAPAARAPVDLRSAVMSPRRKLKDRLATGLMVLAFLVATVPLLFVVGAVVSRGAGVIGGGWFTRNIPDVAAAATSADAAARANAFGVDVSQVQSVAVTNGMQPAIVGTLLTTGLATLLAVPLGILGAIYLNEYGKKGRLASVLRFFTDVMTGVPSIVMGVFIYTVWVIPRGLDGRSAVAGALALGCLMLPIVVRSTEEMLRLVPNSLREASAALGTRTWRTTLGVVLPAALPGITSGCMLAVARAAGETAPLLLTIGSTRFTNWGLGGVNTALSAQIYANATQPGGDALAWGAALTLIVLVLALTLLARLVTSRFAIAQQ